MPRTEQNPNPKEKMYKNPNRIEPYKELHQTEPESKNVQERKTNWTLPHKEPNLTWTQKQKMSKYPKQIEPYPIKNPT